MHIEVQVALNFVISYLYNKLPRRRVNLFGEELEKALKQKFEGHWYPDKPFKGSAFRCLRSATPVDPVIDQAARESGVETQDVRENLPEELSVWIDPGEVSYRIGEKGAVKILYSESENSLGLDKSIIDTRGELARTFNPEAQCFQPIEAVANSLNGLSLGSNSGTPATSPTSASGASIGIANTAVTSNNNGQFINNGGSNGVAGSPDVANPVPGGPTFKPGSPVTTTFIPKSTAPVTFTTAAFAQTKFGSTKLKTSGKRAHRMSPTEFSNYIKQRAVLQQQQQATGVPGSGQNSSAAISPMYHQQHNPQHQHHHPHPPRGSSPQPTRPRSLSPLPASMDPFLLMAAAGQVPPFPAYLNELGPAPGSHKLGFMDSAFGVGNGGNSTGVSDNPKAFLDGINFNLNNLPYSAQYHHLLVAN